MTTNYTPVAVSQAPFNEGMEYARASATTLTIGAGSCTDSTGVYIITTTESITLDTAVNGLNGLDTGSLAADEFYALFAISDPAGYNEPGFLLSLSGTAPLLPAGLYPSNYGAFRRIGWVLTNVSSQFVLFEKKGIYTQYDAPVAVLTAGTATTDTALDLSGAVPTTFGKITIASALTPNAASDTASIRTSGGTGYQIVQVGQVASVVTTLQYPIVPKIVSGVPKIDYKLSTASAALTVTVVGYEDLI